MTTLRESAQQALEALTMMRDTYEEYACPACDHADAAIYALRAALAEPLQEPVQEPVAWLTPRTVDSYMRPDLGYETCSKTDYAAFPVYTAPPQHKPLTQEEIIDLWEGVSDPESPEISMIDFARAIERAHGIGGQE